MTWTTDATDTRRSCCRASWSVVDARARRATVSDQAIVMAVASYRSRAAAEHDFRSVCGKDHGGAPGDVAAAIVEKGADGPLTVGHHGIAERFACGAAILGGALVVVAAPVGIVFLVPTIATKAAWA